MLYFEILINNCLNIEPTMGSIVCFIANIRFCSNIKEEGCQVKASSNNSTGNSKSMMFTK